MSLRRELLLHLRQLHDIRDIMHVMKNLALMETGRLTQRHAALRRITAGIEQAAAEFLRAWPQFRVAGDFTEDIIVVFGSERGFCGSFNETMLQALDALGAGAAGRRPLVLPVGHKLCRRLGTGRQVLRELEGAGVSEEVPAVLEAVVEQIQARQAVHGAGRVIVLAHDEETGAVMQTQLLPALQVLPAEADGSGQAPVINLSAEVLFQKLADEYLLTCLHAIACRSLLAENEQRIRHMTAAIQRLDHRSGELHRRYHRLYQEEITEEIEVILLNATEPLYQNERAGGDGARLSG